MIARTWRGHTRVEDADAYTRLLERTGVRDCRATPGNQGVVVLRRVEGQTAEFLFISFWEDFDAIRRLAGPDVEKAFYYPEDDEYLLGKEPRVTHYEVPAGVAPAAAAGIP
jgi:heme-degrading monooxygenase HmoA